MGVVHLPQMQARERRIGLVARMAADLVRFEAHGSEPDAIRSLFGAGYPMADIVMLVDDARQVAMQEVVAREMAK
jgi:hypothetical protein